MASEQAQPGSDSSPEDSNVPAENPSTESADPSAQTEIDLGAAAQDAPSEARATAAETAPSHSFPLPVPQSIGPSTTQNTSTNEAVCGYAWPVSTLVEARAGDSVAARAEGPPFFVVEVAKATRDCASSSLIAGSAEDVTSGPTPSIVLTVLTCDEDACWAPSTVGT